jgi:hypothetical protein
MNTNENHIRPLNLHNPTETARVKYMPLSRFVGPARGR